MEVQEIVERARSGDLPGNWDVWRLRGDRVSQDLALFIFGAVLGLVLLVFALTAMIPDNFEKGIGAAIISVVILVFLGVLGFGSLGLVSQDLMRLRRRSQYLLIMTPDDFVKVEPGRITHVPMDQITNITLKGVKVKLPEDQEQRVAQAQADARISMAERLVGSLARQPRVSPSLAFIDSRTDEEVVVSSDTAFGDLKAIEDALNFHVRAKARSNLS